MRPVPLISAAVCKRARLKRECLIAVARTRRFLPAAATDLRQNQHSIFSVSLRGLRG